MSEARPQLDGSAVRAWIAANARPVETALLRALDDPGERPAFLSELAAFRNCDGGFGHGLECDLQTPDSSVIATTVAFQHLVDVGAAPDEPLVASGIEYLVRAYDADAGRWPPIPPSTDDHPAAPWWSYARSHSWTDWGNPSAEVLAYLLRFLPPGAHDVLVAEATRRALGRLDEIDRPEFHELFNYQRLYAAAGEDLRERLWPRLAELILVAVAQDADRWPAYGATALKFVPRPDSPFAALFDREAIERDLVQLAASAADGDHWEPNWTWGDAHPGAWPAARSAWAGVLTLRHLRTLEAHGFL